jgi:SAM-dependent methyltransferase
MGNLCADVAQLVERELPKLEVAGSRPVVRFLKAPGPLGRGYDSGVDWGIGSYERIAGQFQPAAESVVAVAAPVAGERVVDLGCGTGNAALIAARSGAEVLGIDPAPRLLEVAAARARDDGLGISFLPGEAASMPLGDGAADLVLSVFGVIFAPDAAAAAAEMARVTAPDGRIVLSAWIPDGAISEASRIGREAVANALGAPAGPPPFAWHDAGALAELLAPHGFGLSVEKRKLAFTAASPREWVEAESRDHPMRVAGAAVLEPRGEAEAILDRTVEIFEAANEDPEGFRVTSSYVIAMARRV